MVTVSSGASSFTNATFACTTIRNLRANLKDILGIPSDATAYVNSVPTDEYYTTRSGDEVIFARPSGSKG